MLGNRRASPKELAAECGEKIGDISYHIKYLHREGCVEMVDTAARRGAIEHYYRTKASVGTSVESIRSLVGEAVRALNAGTFDTREDRRPSWTTMALDERGRRELSERQSRWLAELELLKVEAAERLAREDADGRRMVAAVLCFETPPER
jgi:hypothetical protein